MKTFLRCCRLWSAHGRHVRSFPRSTAAGRGGSASCPMGRITMTTFLIFLATYRGMAAATLRCGHLWCRVWSASFRTATAPCPFPTARHGALKMGPLWWPLPHLWWMLLTCLLARKLRLAVLLRSARRNSTDQVANFQDSFSTPHLCPVRWTYWSRAASTLALASVAKEFTVSKLIRKNVNRWRRLGGAGYQEDTAGGRLFCWSAQG